MAGIRIGVNALYMIPGGVGGTEIYLRSLLQALGEVDSANEYIIFTNRETGVDITPDCPNFCCAPQPVSGVNRPVRILWEQAGLPVAAARGRIDVLLNPGFTAPLFCSCPSVTVFHDLQHKRHPEYFRWWDLPFWRLMLFQAAHTSKMLIAVSEATKRDLLRYYPTTANKVQVIPHGVDEGLFEIALNRRLQKPRPYLLSVSTLHPHKNQERLVRAFARFRRQHPEFELVLAGMRGFHADKLERLIGELDLKSVVRLTGWISRDQLRQLYLDAHYCMYPSTFEGFGLPLLEALAAGVPTACSAIDPFREIAGEAALMFDPEDENSIFNAMVRLASDEDLRERLNHDGPERAGNFSWRKSAQATMEVLCRVARLQSPPAM